MAIRSGLNDRLSRLELRAAHVAFVPMTKRQRDELTRCFLAEGDFDAMLASETEPHRRAAIQAAARADT